LLEEKASPEKIVETAYLAALSRYPTETEREKLVKTVTDASEKDRRGVTEDLFWAILSSKEFLFNH